MHHQKLNFFNDTLHLLIKIKLLILVLKMEIKIRKINSIYFFMLTFFTIINTLMLLKAILTFSYHKLFTHETLWSFFLSSFYLISIFILDANLYLFNSSSLEKYNSFIRNYFSVIAYTYCYTITIEFWFILFLGLAFGKNPFSEKKEVPRTVIYDTLYLHLGITIIMLFDLFCAKRKLIKNKTLSFIINFIFFWYCVVVLCTNYVYFMPAYPFMKDAGVMLMVTTFIFSLALINLCHYLHLYLVKIINKAHEIEIRKNI